MATEPASRPRLPSNRPRADAAKGKPRSVPVQSRARLTVELIYAAAEQLVDEVGLEYVSMNAVAERVHRSIGTVYRYFPERHTLLSSLAQRTAVALVTDAAAEIRRLDRGRTGVERALEQWPGFLVRRFGSQRGFQAIAYDHAFELSLPVAAEIETVGGVFTVQSPAAAVAGRIAALDDGVSADRRLVRDIETYLVVCLGLIGRAFRRDRLGDPALLADADRVIEVALGDILSRLRGGRAGAGRA